MVMYLRRNLCLDHVIEHSELKSKDRCSCEAVGKEQDFSYHASIGHHHGNWPKVRFQIVWKLHSSSVTTGNRIEIEL